MKRKYRLSPAAQKKMQAIAEYSEEIWGHNQQEKYISALFKRFEYLAKNPDKGKDRSYILPKLQSYSEGSHVIYYVKFKSGIEITDILHNRMQPGLHLG